MVWVHDTFREDDLKPHGVGAASGFREAAVTPFSTRTAALSAREGVAPSSSPGPAPSPVSSPTCGHPQVPREGKEEPLTAGTERPVSLRACRRAGFSLTKARPTPVRAISLPRASTRWGPLDGVRRFFCTRWGFTGFSSSFAHMPNGLVFKWQTDLPSPNPGWSSCTSLSMHRWAAC